MTTDTKPLAERLNLARTIEQYRNGSPGAIAAGSPDQVINALRDAKHDILMLAEALDAQAALLSEARDRIADIITIQDIATRTPAAARLSENEIASYRSLLCKLTEATKP